LFGSDESWLYHHNGGTERLVLHSTLERETSEG